jgi:hypothetical protein
MSQLFYYAGVLVSTNVLNFFFLTVTILIVGRDYHVSIVGLWDKNVVSNLLLF